MTKQEFYQGFQAVLTAASVQQFNSTVDFSVEKVAKGVKLSVPPAHLWINMIDTVVLAERARVELGAPLRVNSHYRDPAYNRAVGGAGDSRHRYFNALDLMPLDPKVTPRRLYDFFVRQPEASRMGIGLYDTFVHIDTRGYAARF